MNLKKAEAIVLRSRDFGEAHKILTLYTLKEGKISVLARGVKKSKSRLAALCHPFSYGNYLLYAGKSLYTLNQGEILSSHHQLREDLWKLAYATYFCELVDLGTEEEGNEKIFQLLLQSFLLLQEEKITFLTARFFEIRFLAFSGYYPYLDNCVVCQNSLSEKKQKFSARQGGLLCPFCWKTDQYAMNISLETVKIIKRLLSPQGWNLRNLKVSQAAKAELEKILRVFLLQHLPAQPKSLSFLKNLAQV